jgi:hypothetical protein
MAAGQNPLAALQAAMLMAKLGGGAGAGGGPPGIGAMAMGAPPSGGPGAAGPSGSPGDAAANAGFGRELSSLRQADPMALAKQIVQMRSQITSMISQSGTTIPGMSRALAKTLQGLDAAVKEAQTAAATMHTALPIQASAAQGAPGMGSQPTPGPSMGGS